jgi:predicted nucleic acid-binding protein
LIVLDTSVLIDALCGQRGSAAARLYVTLSRPRGREIDLAIAACALPLEARLWTRNPRDFRDLPGLQLYQAG